MEENDCQWLRNLKKSISGNRQLQFYNLMEVAFISDSTAELEMVKFIEFETSTEQIHLTTVIDKRVSLYRNLKQKENAKCQLLWYFPLTREKYRFTISPHCIEKESYSQYPQANAFENLWNTLDPETKKDFHSLEPESFTVEKQELTDLDRFNTPEKIEISSNFVWMLFEVLEVEYTSLPMPQVIANSRHVKFESLFQPYKKSKKYLHKRVEGEWKVSALNP